MEKLPGNNQTTERNPGRKRRDFIKKGIIFVAVSGAAGTGLMHGCRGEEEENISPAEDLMREHGLLNRVMLIYDTCILRLENGTFFPGETLKNSAGIIRSFIENYHERLEENFIFPRFIRAGQLADLVHILKDQHIAGRIITDRIINFPEISGNAAVSENQRLIKLLSGFNRMYRAHESREDTVLFPSLPKIISPKELAALGEDFEKEEHLLFGENGFESMVAKVADIEKQLGIYDLLQFTPDLQ